MTSLQLICHTLFPTLNMEDVGQRRDKREREREEEESIQ